MARSKLIAVVALFLAVPLVMQQQTKLRGSEEPSVFTYEALSCFGSCPTYDANLFEDGLLIFNGRLYTAHDGIHRQQVAPSLFARLAAEFDVLASLEAEMDCEGYNTDRPGVRLLLRTREGSKEIDYNYGCSVPNEDFLRQLDKITNLLPIQELAKPSGKTFFDN